MEGHEDRSPEVEAVFGFETAVMNVDVDLLAERDQLEGGESSVVLDSGYVVP